MPSPGREMMGDATIQLRANGTPALVTGDNLSRALDQDPRFRKLQSESGYEEIAYAFLESQRELFQLNNPGTELIKTGQTVDDLAFKHLKFQQVSNGVPVWGRELLVHLNRNNEVYQVNGHIEPSADIATTPQLGKEAARARALAALPGDSAGWRAEGSKLYVYYGEIGGPRLVYVVTLAGGLLKDHYFIDANDGALVHLIPGTTR